MKEWKRYDLRALKPEAEEERIKLGIGTAEYKLLVFIRDAGVVGVRWGSLPAQASHRLLEKKLVNVAHGVVRVGEYAP